MSCGCHEGIDAGSLKARQRRVLVAVLVINVVTFGMMLAASRISGSSSLLSGALDNLGDAVTYGISLAVVTASTSAKARVALLKGLLILGASIAVGVQIVAHVLNPDTPVAATMGVAAAANLGANALCLWLLNPHRHDDVNMSSVWECSRNDVIDGTAVIITALAVWIFDSGWPDIIVACALLVLFTRSAARVLRSAWANLQQPTAGADTGPATRL